LCPKALGAPGRLVSRSGGLWSARADLHGVGDASCLHGAHGRLGPDLPEGHAALGDRRGITGLTMSLEGQRQEPDGTLTS